MGANILSESLLAESWIFELRANCEILENVNPREVLRLHVLLLRQLRKLPPATSATCKRVHNYHHCCCNISTCDQNRIVGSGSMWRKTNESDELRPDVIHWINEYGARSLIPQQSYLYRTVLQEYYGKWQLPNESCQIIVGPSARPIENTSSWRLPRRSLDGK